MTRLICYLIIVSAVLASSSCSADTNKNRDVCPRISSSSYYFAKGSLSSTNSNLDKFVREWYSKHMSAMNEPSLSCGTPGETYRFTWLRSFHNPVSLRVEVQEGIATLHSIELDGAGGYEPGNVLRKDERVLSSGELNEIRSIFLDSNFHSLPTTVDRMGADGAEWILEQSGSGGYHLVIRWSPDSGEVYKIGNLFLTLSGWSFDEVY